MINSFDGPYRFLSNFDHIDPFIYNGLRFVTIETAYQAQKTLDPDERQHISMMFPPHAKRAGKKVKLRPDWNDIKLQVMRELIDIKFDQPRYKNLLLATGDQELIEGNFWGDTFYGVCRGIGENHLGKLIMEKRSSLKQTTCIPQ